MHYSVIFNDNSLLSEFINVNNLNYTSDDTQDRMLYLRKYLHNFTDFKDKKIQLQNLERLTRLQRLNKLDNLQTDNIRFYSDDYQNIPLTDKDAVINCDIPYLNTNKYKHSFDYERFYSWAEKQEVPVYISEYEMPKDRFVCVAEKEKICRFSSTNNSKVAIERIFRPKTQL